MTTPAVDPFADLAALSNRIAQTLKANPKDAQVRADLRYVQNLLAGRATQSADASPEPSAGAQIKAGLSAVPGDMVRGLLGTILHPLQTAGQLTGLANRENLRAVAHDPNASAPEKLDALVRATPFNAGYAPMRSFLESTGMKSDEAAPLSEQVRQGGDIAVSLLGMRYGGRVTKATVGRLVPRISNLFKRVTAAFPEGSPQEVGGITENMVRRGLTSYGVEPEVINRAWEAFKKTGQLDVRTPPPEAPPVSRPGETLSPIPGSPRGFEVNGVRPTPAAPTTPTVTEILTGQRQTGMPDIGQGQTLPYSPRGGRVQQSVAPYPQTSPPVSGVPDPIAGHSQAFVDFLKASTSPTDAVGRLGTLRALGIQGLPADADLLAVLGLSR